SGRAFRNVKSKRLSSLDFIATTGGTAALEGTAQAAGVANRHHAGLSLAVASQDRETDGNSHSEIEKLLDQHPRRTAFATMAGGTSSSQQRTGVHQRHFAIKPGSKPTQRPARSALPSPPTLCHQSSSTGCRILHVRRYWEIIADNLSKAGWSLGWLAALDCEGRTIWIFDAHRDDGKRFVVRADEILTAFLGTRIGN